jgi:ribonucleoside-diphosphate reductase alpha chain
MNKVLRMHREEVSNIDPSMVSEELLSAAASAWDEAVELGGRYGVRNSQATLLAPTGTIGLMMDCDTTGIEPDLGLTKVKKLVGGGTMFIVNQTVPRALKALGYNRSQIEDIVNYIDVEKTIIGSPHLKEEHLPVFSCSMGDNAIHYMGHVKMMSAVQPFLSGAISKTVNMPEEVTVEEVEKLHMEAWKLGLKAVAIYRDNCKVAQPLSMAKKEGKEEDSPSVTANVAETPDQVMAIAAENMAPAGASIIRQPGVREDLPRIRDSKTFKFTISGSRGYVTVGEYPDGRPGELFISISKQGSTLRGVMDAFATSVSFGLQYGVPLKKLVKSFTHTSFAPAGITDDPDIRTASSIIDYIFKRLGKSYLSFDDQLEVGIASIDDMPVGQASLLDAAEIAEEVSQAEQSIATEVQQAEASTAPMPSVSASTEQPAASQAPVVPSADSKSAVGDASAPLCYNCGNQTQRAGTCYVCTACGSTTGCS